MPANFDKQAVPFLLVKWCSRSAMLHGGHLPRTDRAHPLRFYMKAPIVSLVEAQGDHLANPNLDLPQGTLDLLILKALSLEPMHGWAISERIHQVSRTALTIPQGSLYPALHRLERRGWVRAEWGVSQNNRKAKYYQLTRAGRKQLAVESEDWARLTAAVALVLDMG